MAAEINNIPYKIYLSEDEMPKAWYNVRADMKVKPAPLLNPGTGKPMDLARLSTVIRTALLRGGLEQLSLGDLSRLSRRGSQRQTVLARLSAVGSLTREEVMDLLGVSKSAALKLLNQLRQDGAVKSTEMSRIKAALPYGL